MAAAWSHSELLRLQSVEDARATQALQETILRKKQASEAALASGGGVSKLYANHVAFAALTNNGGVVSWGDQANGGDSSSVTSSLVNVKYIESSGSAFTAVVD